MTAKLWVTFKLCDAGNIRCMLLFNLQNQICNRQIKRMDDERTKLQEKLEEAAEKEKEFGRQLQDIERKETDQDSKVGL